MQLQTPKQGSCRVVRDIPYRQMILKRCGSTVVLEGPRIKQDLEQDLRSWGKNLDTSLGSHFLGFCRPTDGGKEEFLYIVLAPVAMFFLR